MWESDQLTPIPSTRKPFYITSNRGHYFFIKPGKSFIFDKKWIKITETALINNKISRFVISPLGKSAIHIPNSGTYVAIHENRQRQRLTLIPIPVTTGSESGDYIQSVYSPNGENLLITRPFESLSQAPSKGVSCGADIRGIAVSDTGHAFAIAMGSHFWVWQQIEDSPRGVGFWTDLTADSRFGTNLMANQPRAEDVNNYHGFMRPRQTFTLHPSLSPQVPANCAVCYQDLCLFDNPDEGKGIISFTTLLPPSKPFDTLFIFSSVCKFGSGTKPTFERYSTTLPIYEGGATPCVWWSSCCRMAVIAVSNSIVIITRTLHVIAIIPMEKVLPLGDQKVASIAWSACGQYFIITSMNGAISAITRGGQSMKHQLCGLRPFGGTPNVPLMVVGDCYDPGLFIVYSKLAMRPLRIDTSSIPHTLGVVMSLPFPLGSSAPMYENAVQVISSNDYTDKKKLAELIFYTSLYQIFPNYSPLRYLIISLIDDAAIKIYENGDDLFSLLLLRCVLWVTDHELPTYKPILERLNYTKSPREQHIRYILQYELERNDYVEVKKHNIDVIKMFDEENSAEDEAEYEKPDDGKEQNLDDVMKAVKEAMYGNEKSAYLEINANLKPLFDYLVFAGRFEQAYALGSHPSILLETCELFEAIAERIGDDAPKLYKAMVVCIGGSPEQENEIRAACVSFLNKILRKRIIDTMPGEDGKTKKLSSLIDVEEQFEVVCPDDETQCNDFAVITSIAIAAADYRNVTNFLKRESSLIPPNLIDPIRELFRLLWFVHYRESAIHDLCLDQAYDSCLRLLGFPDFMNLSIVEDHIKKYPSSNYSPDIYAHYIAGNREYDQDPGFVDAAEAWLSNMSQRSLKRVIDAVECFTEKDDEVPHSRLLYSMVVSHILPYLRCALARSLSGFDAGDNLPPELTDFEDFSLPNTEDHNMTIKRFEPQDVNDISDISAGEFHPTIVPQPPSTQKKRRRKHHHRKHQQYEEESESEPIIKKKKKKPIRRTESSDSDDLGLTLRPLIIDKKGRHRAPASFDFEIPPQTYNPPQDIYGDPYGVQYITPGYMQQLPDIIHGYVEAPPEQAFAPVWDIDPSDFVKQEKQEPVVEEKPAVKEEKEVFVEPKKRYSTKSVSCEMEPEKEDIPIKQEPQRPKIIYVSRPVQPPEPEIHDFESDSSEISDISFTPTERQPIRHQDPFPIDNALNQRINMLLGEANNDISINPLRPTPRFNQMQVTHPPVNTNIQFSTTPPVNVSVSPKPDDHVTAETQATDERRTAFTGIRVMEVNKTKVVGDSFISDDDGSDTPDFRPRVVSMKRDNVVSVKHRNINIQAIEIPQKKVVLREITSSHSEEESV